MWFVTYVDGAFGEEYYGKGETPEKAWDDLSSVCTPNHRNCVWYLAEPAKVIVEQRIEFTY